MKTIKFLILILLVTGSTSCIVNFNETIYGSGNVITEARDVSGIDGLKVSTGIDVVIKQGDKESLEIHADDNLMEHIKTEIVEGTLKIYTDKSIRQEKSLKAYLMYKDLNMLRITSAGDVTGENTLKTEKLRIDVSSAGDLKLDVEADEISLDISSSGDVRISGTAGYMDADLSSAGDLNAYELIVKDCEVDCSSAGDARIYATGEMDLSCSSAGSIYYRGDAVLVSSHTSSAGSIVRK